MSDSKESLLLISDFNIDVLKGLVENDCRLPKLVSSVAPFGQVYQILIDDTAAVWLSSPDYVAVWTRPEAILPTFEAALSFRSISIDSLLTEVDHFCNAVADMTRRVSYTLVASWSMNPRFRGYGMIEMLPGTGAKDLLVRANQRLVENLADVPGVAVLDAERWVSVSGSTAYNPKLWYLSKVPFDNAVFKVAVSDIKAAIRGVRGESRKLVIVDLDDTLWGGIVGDIGWEQLQLGGHDAAGESFVDFQRSLKALTNRGILLAIVSKNTEAIAMEAIQSHPEMVLSLDDFAGWRINWNDKAANIVDLVEELNLGLQSVVFIDDNPAERGRVGDALPEVFVPEWPANRLMYSTALCELDCFDVPVLSEEDRKRTIMYSTERVRRQTRDQVSSMDEWLKTLNMEVSVEMLNKSNLARAAQLLNKTNQMNLRTRRFAANEFQRWAECDNHQTWVFSVRDNYGDSGLAGLVSVEIDGGQTSIIDFVLSCRVMGRKIEETMLHVVGNYCADHSSNGFTAEIIETPKNMPCIDFFRQSGMQQDESTGTFRWCKGEPYPLPESVQLRNTSSYIKQTLSKRQISTP